MPNYWFDHVHVISPDPLKTAEFYEKTFDARKVATSELGEGRILVDLDLSGAAIKVMSPRTQPLIPSAPQTGLEHFALRTDNFEAAVEELKAKGVKFVQDVRIAQSGLKVAAFLAPENVLIELMETSG